MVTPLAKESVYTWQTCQLVQWGLQHVVWVCLSDLALGIDGLLDKQTRAVQVDVWVEVLAADESCSIRGQKPSHRVQRNGRARIATQSGANVRVY